MSEDPGKGFGETIHAMWIGPEIEKRAREGRLPPDFRIYRCLIRMPQAAPVIVEFNEEIAWMAKVKVAGGRAIQPGEPAFLHDVEQIEDVEAPTVEGTREASVYLFWDGTEWRAVFDFTPNWPPHLASPDERDWSCGRHIASSLQAILTAGVIRIHDAVQADLTKIGLWGAPALLPYPPSKIALLLGGGISKPPGLCSSAIARPSSSPRSPRSGGRCRSFSTAVGCWRRSWARMARGNTA